MLGRPLAFIALEPFTGNGLERIPAACLGCRHGFLHLAGVNPLLKGCFRLLRFLPRLFQANLGVTSYGQCLFFTPKAVLEPPCFPASRGDGKIQSAAVKKFQIFICWG